MYVVLIQYSSNVLAMAHLLPEHRRYMKRFASILLELCYLLSLAVRTSAVTSYLDDLVIYWGIQNSAINSNHVYITN